MTEITKAEKDENKEKKWKKGPDFHRLYLGIHCVI